MIGVSQILYKPALGWRKRRRINMSKSDGGKGSSPRPFSVSQAEYDARWDMIFGRDLKEEEPQDLSEDSEQSEEEDDYLRCVRCGGVDTMYIVPNGMHMVCDQCGYAERVLPSEKDF